LGANISKFQLPDGSEAWLASARDYIKMAVQNIEEVLSNNTLPSKLRNKVDCPLPLTYHPMVDISPVLEPQFIMHFQTALGLIHWIVELGCIDILMEVSMLSAHNVLPREGHLEAIYHIFSYLKSHENSRLVFDPAYLNIDDRRFHIGDWTDFYPGAYDELPPHMPEPQGLHVDITCFVDTDHAGNLHTHCLQTEILIFINKAPIIWYSKWQNTVESSTFGSKLVALRIATDLIVALPYKLHMFGVPLLGPTNVLCDNQGIMNTTTLPESVLTKKHNQICYHQVREAVATNIICIAKEDSTTNLADTLTKPLRLHLKRMNPLY